MTTIKQELQRIKTAKQNIKEKIEEKGVTVPSTTRIDGYPSLVESIPESVTPSILNPFNGNTFGSETLVGSMTHQYVVSGGIISQCYLFSNGTPYISGMNFITSDTSGLVVSPYVKELGTYFNGNNYTGMLLTITDSGLLTITGKRTQSKVEEYPWMLSYMVLVLIKLDTGILLCDYLRPYGLYSCFVKGTQITLSNRAKKNVEDITYNDRLLVWDFDEGKMSYATPVWIQKSRAAEYYYAVNLSNGTALKLVGANGKCHRLFNVERGEFVYAIDMVREHTIDKDGNIVEVVSCERIEEPVEYYNIITDYHMNLYADDILTSCRYSNLYQIVDMKYVKEERETIPYEMFDSKAVSREYYDGLRLGEQTIPVEETNKYCERLKFYDSMF